MKSIFIICPVRNISKDDEYDLLKYHSEGINRGYYIHLPLLDTNQNEIGIEICRQNINAIKKADEVHVWYDPESQGVHFDLGVAMSLNKKIQFINEPISRPQNKSFEQLVIDLQNETKKN